MFSVEAEWSPTWDAGGSADEDFFDEVFNVWQVHEIWAESIYSAGLSLLGLAYVSNWLATVANMSLAEASVTETD